MKIAVIGNGTMGAGIVQCAAQHNMDIVMKGRSKESLDKAMLKLKKNFARLVEKGKITNNLLSTMPILRLHKTLQI